MKLQTFFAAAISLLALISISRGADQRTSSDAGFNRAFDQANVEFSQKDFGRAAADYQAIIARQGFSAPVLFNLANSYYRDGKLGLAILNYQRAQLLAPGDADISLNLHLARSKAGLADRPATWLDRASHFFSLNTFSWIASAAALLIGAGIVAQQMSRGGRFGWRFAMAASACILLASVSAIVVRWPELNEAIVTVKNTPVYISPVTVGQPLYTLADGQTVAACNEHGEFTLVQMSDGHRGWVKTADVGRLISRAQEEPIAAT